MKSKKIFIACDTKSIKKVKRIIKETRSNKIRVGYKFGLEFFNFEIKFLPFFEFRNSNPNL